MTNFSLEENAPQVYKVTGLEMELVVIGHQ